MRFWGTSLNDRAAAGNSDADLQQVIHGVVESSLDTLKTIVTPPLDTSFRQCIGQATSLEADLWMAVQNVFLDADIRADIRALLANGS